MAIIESLPRGNAELKDQLKRAALSIPLNIAESCGKISDADRARFVAIARGSAMESGACLDCMRLIYPTIAEQGIRGKVLVERMVEMLSKMCR